MANLPNANDLTQRFALDVQGFDALRAQAKASPQAGAKAVAGQFDAMFTEMMLKSMRDATPDGGLLDSHTSKMYTSMLDQQLAHRQEARPAGRGSRSGLRHADRHCSAQQSAFSAAWAQGGHRRSPS